MHSIAIIVFSLLTVILFANIFDSWLQTAYSALPNVRFSTVGDWGCNSNTGRTVDNINSKTPDRILALGDYSYQSTATCWFNTIKSIDSKTRINIGNHDDETSSLLNSFMNHFGLSKQYYSFDYPPNQPYIHILTMSTELSTSSSSAQFTFVKNDLQSASQKPNIKWIIVNLHKPIYASPSTCGASSCQGSSSLRDTYHPLFDQYKVDLVLEGHTHDYQRTFPLKYNPSSKSNPIKTSTDLNNYNSPGGRIFAIVGTGGINFHGLAGKASFTASQQDNRFGILDLQFINDGSKLEGKFYANLPDGKVKDQFSITKSFSNSAPTATGQTVSINKNTSKAITITASDPDGDALTYTKLTDPTHGVLTGTLPFLTYTPDTDYTGPDSFTFKANDGNADSNIATVSINVIESVGGYHYAPSFTATGSNFQDVPSESKYQIPRFTVASWFKTSANYGTGSGMIVNKGGFGSDTTGLNMNFGLWIFSNKLSGGFETSSGPDNFVTSAGTYNDGEWHYGTVTYDGSAVRVYVDGVQVASKSTTSSPETSGTLPVRIGANSQKLNSFFSGNVDEVRVWNKGLTAQQVLEAYNDNFSTQGSPVLHLDFSAASASSLRASSATTIGPVAMAQKVNVTKDTATPIVLTSSQPKGTDLALTYTVLTQPLHGKLTGKAPSLLYIPASGYTGPDRFNFKVNDGIADSNIATIGLTVNDKPRISVIQPSQPSTAKESLNIANNGSSSNNTVTDRDKTADKTTQEQQEGQEQRQPQPQQHVNPNNRPKDNQTIDTDSTSSLIDQQQQQQQPRNTTQSLQQEQQSNSRSNPGDLPQAIRANEVPMADAGVNRVVEEGKLVTLDGSKSKDRDGNVVSYVWKQIFGPKVELEHFNEHTSSFMAPSVAKDENLIFTLTVTDDTGGMNSESLRVKVVNVADSLNQTATG